MPVPGARNLITDVDGLSVGNAADDDVWTGVTVVLPDTRCLAAVDVRGGGPGTRETDLLDPSTLVDAVDAVVLAGGSSYGLEAASRVAALLGAQGRGYRLGESPLASPIVPAAILFDLTNGGRKGWGAAPPYGRLGEEALQAAARTFELGTAGAGYGARAGLLKGGLGSVSLVDGPWQVGALVAANPMGSVIVPGTNSFWAAPFALNGELGAVPPAGVPVAPGWPEDTKLAAAPTGPQPGGHTTLAVVAVNAGLTQAEAKRLAMMAQDGLARAVRPVHSPLDGDIVFALATGAEDLPEPRALSLAKLGHYAADCVARAVARGVYEAASLGVVQSYRDWVAGRSQSG